jgi:hypothetical protein
MNCGGDYCILDSNINGQLQHQRSGLSANRRLSCGSSSGSLDSMTDAGAPVVEFHNGVEETESDGSQMPVETKGFVYNNDSPKTKTRLEIVNNIESLKMESQLKFVNSNKTGLKMENHFEDEGGEFD